MRLPLGFLWQALFLACLVCASVVAAGPFAGFGYLEDEGAGTAGLHFLKLPKGARANSMGGFDGSAVRDASGVFWNPARLPLVNGFQAQLNHAEYYGEWRQEGVAAVVGVPLLGNLGLSFDGLFATPFENARDIEENSVEINALDYALGLAWGYPLWRDRWLWGGRFSWLHSQLDDILGDGYAVDLATSWALPSGIWGSAVLQNLSSGFSYRSGTGAQTKLPTMLRLGVGYADTTSAWAWQLGYSKSNDAVHRMHGGLEWNWQARYFLRSGYEWDLQNPESGWLRGLGLGLGLKLSTLGIDYAWRSQGYLGSVHTFSLLVNPPVPYRKVPDHLLLAREAYASGSCQDAQKHARLALREDPSAWDALVIVQACVKEEKVAHSEYLAFAFSGNTEGWVLPRMDGERLLGGLSRRKAVLEQLRMSYPGLLYLDAGRLGEGEREESFARLLDLYSQLPVDVVLLSPSDSGMVSRLGWKNRLPWLGVGANSSWRMLRMGKKEIAVFAFAEGRERSFSIDSAMAEVRRVRESWRRPPAVQVILFDGGIAGAERLAQALDGIDLILLAGQSDVIQRPMRVQQTWISSPGRGGSHLGLAVLWMDAESLRWEFQMHPLDDAVRPDSLFAQVLNESPVHESGENRKVMTQEGKGDYLFYAYQPDGRRDIWLGSAEGKAARRLTREPGLLREARLALSRKIFVFVADSAHGQSHVFWQRLTEKTPHPMIGGVGRILRLEFEPYENWLYYLRPGDSDVVDLWRCSWKGSHCSNLSQGRFGVLRDFVISPDGKQLILEADSAGQGRLWRSGLTLGRRESLSADSLQAKEARFHPSGRLVAYLTKPRQDDGALWTPMLWDTHRDQVRPLGGAREVHRLAWSTDGRLLYMEVGVNRRNVVALEVASGEERPLRSSFEEILEEAQPRAQWQGGKEGVLFEAGKAGERTLYWMPREGDTPQPIYTKSPIALP